MPQSYSDENAAGATPPHPGGAPPPGGDELRLARHLIAQLVRNADADLLIAALLAERSPKSASRPTAVPAASTPPAAPTRQPLPPGASAPPAPADPDPAAAELARVRRQLMLGQAHREWRHELNNPLTALLAEAEMLEMEAATAEQEEAATRIVELARRIVALTRRVDDPSSAGSGG